MIFFNLQTLFSEESLLLINGCVANTLSGYPGNKTSFLCVRHEYNSYHDFFN